ncbi:MAG: hypothetical protein IPP57_14055 [Candidatus Obscuribacter sp.]|nr:hypothetical protein [Candidatus Obscuribacter sp.]
MTFADEQPIYRNTHPLIEGNSAEDFQNGTEEKYAKKGNERNHVQYSV